MICRLDHLELTMCGRGLALQLGILEDRIEFQFFRLNYTDWMKISSVTSHTIASTERR